VEGDVDRLAENLLREPGIIEATATDGELRVRMEDADGAVARVVAVASRGEFSLRSLSLEEASLETVFITLTGKELRE